MPKRQTAFMFYNAKRQNTKNSQGGKQMRKLRSVGGGWPAGSLARLLAEWAGLDWAMLGWAGMGWAGPGWDGLIVFFVFSISE